MELFLLILCGILYIIGLLSTHNWHKSILALDAYEKVGNEDLEVFRECFLNMYMERAIGIWIMCIFWPFYTTYFNFFMRIKDND